MDTYGAVEFALMGKFRKSSANEDEQGDYIVFMPHQEFLDAGKFQLSVSSRTISKAKYLINDPMS
jgi:hypothetical protein